MFDGLYNYGFMQTLIDHNNYSKETVDKKDFDCFVLEAAETKVFPKQWRVLASFCRLKENDMREKDANRIKFKKGNFFGCRTQTIFLGGK